VPAQPVEGHRPEIGHRRRPDAECSGPVDRYLVPVNAGGEVAGRSLGRGQPGKGLHFEIAPPELGRDGQDVARVAAHRLDVHRPEAGVGEVDQDLGTPVSLLRRQRNEGGVELAAGVGPHRHTDKGPTSPGVQLAQQVVAAEALRQGDRARVVGCGVPRRQEPHRRVASGDGVLESWLVHTRGQRVASELCGGRARYL
jgi:hypothetical protein